VIKLAGLEVKDRFTDFFVSDKDFNFVDDFLSKEFIDSDPFLVGINPGGNWDPKRWPKEYFTELSSRLIKEFNARIIITGSAKDLTLAEEIRAGAKDKITLVCGKFNLKQFAVICKVLDLFISADSGPLHIANSVGAKKIIALFGPTDIAVTGPYPQDNVMILQKDTGCKIPCYAVDCKNNRCMKSITVDEVMNTIRDLIDK
jgi:ADP-heptose:LPS heptosyltransferase